MGNKKQGILDGVTAKSVLLLTLNTEVNLISNHLKVGSRFNALTIVCISFKYKIDKIQVKKQNIA